MPQCFNGTELCSFLRGIQSKEDANYRGKDRGTHHGSPVNLRMNVDDSTEQIRAAHAKDNANDTAKKRDDG